MHVSRVPKWVWGVGIVAVVVAVNALLGLVNFVTASPASCLSCHGTGGTPDMSRQSAVHPSYRVVACVDCHSRKGGDVLVEGYRGGFSADPQRTSAECTKCHSGVTRKNDAGGFKYNSLQITVSHETHVSKRGATCTDCHQNIAHDLGSQPTYRPRMEYCYACHDQATTSCTKCHSGQIPAAAGSPVFRATPVKAEDTGPKSAGTGSTGTSSAPASSAGPPAVPHALEGRSACLACHEAGVGGSTRVPGSHAGRPNESCSLCHKR